MFSKRKFWYSIFLWLLSLQKHQVEGPKHHNKSDETKSAGWFSSCGGLFMSESKLVKTGIKLQKEQKFNEAIECFTEAIAKNPLAQYYKLRALCYKEKGSPSMALKDYREVLKKDPENNEDRLFLADLAYDTGNYEEAVTETIRASDDEALVRLGDKLFQNYRLYHQAIRCYSAVIDKNPAGASAQLYRKRGKSYLRNRNWKEAYQDFRQVLEFGSYDKEDRISYNTALFESGNYGLAVDEILRQNDPEELIKLAKNLVSKRKYNLAISCYTPLIDKNPSNSEYYKLRGQCYKDVNYYELAISDFYQARQNGSHDDSIRYSLRDAIYNFGKFNEKTDNALTILEESDLRRLGEDFYHAEKMEEAVHCFTIAIDKYPSKPELYKLRGKCYRKMKRLDMAISDFKTAIQMDPNDEANQVSLRRALLDVEKFDEIPRETLVLLNDNELDTFAFDLIQKEKFKDALRCMNEAIEKNPNRVRYYRRRGGCHYSMNNFELAIFDFEKMVRLKPEKQENRDQFLEELLKYEKFNELPDETILVLTPQELEHLAEEFSSVRKFKEALRCYEKAIEKDGLKVEYIRKRGQCYQEMNNFDKALAEFLKMVEIDPNNQENEAILISTVFNSGLLDSTIDTLPLNDVGFVRLGDKFYATKKYEEAFRCFTKAIDRYPTESLYYQKRGLCYSKMKNFQNAIIDLEEAVRIKPSSMKYRFFLSETFADCERFEDAKRVLMSLDDERAEEAHALIEALKEKQRMKDLVLTSRNLIYEDIKRKVSKIEKEEMDRSDIGELQKKIDELEWIRDNYIEELTEAYDDYAGLNVKSQSFGKSTSLYLPLSCEIPNYLFDQLTYELFSDPVISPEGITFERQILLDYKKGHSGKDPISGSIYSEKKLIPNLAIKEAANLWALQNSRPKNKTLELP